MDRSKTPISAAHLAEYEQDFFVTLSSKGAVATVAKTMTAVRSASDWEGLATDSSIPDSALQLFDKDFYTRQYTDMAGKNIDPLDHFFKYGYREGRKPNFYFDTEWYLNCNHDVAELGLNPLIHYSMYGEQEGRKPSIIFDPVWYKERHKLTNEQGALAHYLQRRSSGSVSPVPEFDMEFYLDRNQDIVTAGIDPVEHYISYGYREGRNPSEKFNTDYYVRRYLGGHLDECPLLHYLKHRDDPGVHPGPNEDDLTTTSEVKKFAKPSSMFEHFIPRTSLSTPRAKVLAYYLPQFHSFPENDEWWGAGFTEWTNLPRGLPRFQGHYQPRIPRDLGFYNLSNINDIRRQVEIATAAGIFGFVFYYYWFNTKRLMADPLDLFCADDKVAMPFCLMWANENWTRRWDGSENEILIAQNYRDEDDRALCADFVKYFRNSRYIRLQSRPLLMVYRPSAIPNTKTKIARLREIFRNEHNEDPIFICAQTFGAIEPEPFGFDGAIEFPPHKLCVNLQQINKSLKVLDFDFSAQVYDYEDVAQASLRADIPSYPLIKSIVPSWDNDARRQGAGLVITGSTPERYERWLSAIIDHARVHPFFGEPIVCVNAWNEWCEGAYLEPDLHFGSAYLNATSRAVFGYSRIAYPKLLLVGHDAFEAGAQLLLLNIGRTLQRNFGVEVEFLLLGGGNLISEYNTVARTHTCSDVLGLRKFFDEIASRGFLQAIVNTAASAHVHPIAAAAGIHCIQLIHELPRILKERHLSNAVQVALERAEKVVFASAYVQDRVLEHVEGGKQAGKCLILPQGLYAHIEHSSSGAEDVRNELKIRPGDKVVLASGYADLRKGIDLFLQLWRMFANEETPIHFVWVGRLDPTLESWLGKEIQRASRTGTFHLTGHRSDIQNFYSIADCFVLTSREDPYPSVVLEALSAGLGVIAFEDAGGIPNLLQEMEVGSTVPYGDTLAMAEAIRAYLDKPVTLAQRLEQGNSAQRRFDFETYVSKLLRLTWSDLKLVSVSIPNFNYSNFLDERLRSVFSQSSPVREVIVLDDASTDDSLHKVTETARAQNRNIRFIVNHVNSGSVFSQWRRAAEAAVADYIWIAEADDTCEPTFLSQCLKLFDDCSDVAFVFTDSKAIGTDGSMIYESYKPYYKDVCALGLDKTAVFNGIDFVSNFLAVRNVVLNASGVVWRRESLLQAIHATEHLLPRLRAAGDWLIYLSALSKRGAKVGYEAAILNHHRRHKDSVTHQLDAAAHIAEVAEVHNFANSIFELDRSVKERQKAYLTEIEDLFSSSRLTETLNV
ncbi:glycoside hydrolase family 99-like domain-containing protein [Methylobacterium frigidaeris]|uniref:Glycosyl transferase family 1 n=1 Tax=Methylobacterium frigidaeris TaxID=2038277 RepID=A0AA37HIP7_9HYPH|nr:glycoside hydrolase family 99-like domain-containing protein [Methylobacterium frigidaeris]GJD66304.1 hypothetical protein MPEAHAMD_6501 [Methylobacterium frigidaeris]